MTEEEKYAAVWWTTPFGVWVRKYGTRNLGRELEVTSGAVHSWVRGILQPRPKNAMRIVELSEDRLSIDDIYKQSALVKALLCNPSV